MRYQTASAVLTGPLLALICGLCLIRTADAQPPEVRARMEMERAKAAAMAAQAGAAQPGESPQPGMPQPGQPGPMPGGDKKPDGDKKDSAPEGPVTRPAAPAFNPDPNELEVLPNAAGKLRLNFTGQPWPQVIQWLKKVSALSLDWQELPSGYLNLVTHREYTVDEARNIINRHLLARGYTILVRDELMTVEKTATLNAALVPRITAAELDDCDDYEFVKVSFALRSMIADAAAEELKPMLSPNGKMTPLKTTNRLEAIDAVINLREIYHILEQEQSNAGEERLVRPFPLKNIRAEDAVTSLKELLGLAKPAAAMNPQQMQQMQQMQMQMAQQQAQNGGKGGPPQKEPEINLIAIVRDNSVLAHAPPDKMAIIEAAVELLDQPQTNRSTGLLAFSDTEVYRLAKLDPEKFIAMLQEMGGLSPRTILQADQPGQSIIVSGQKSDHIIVQLMIDKLDKSGRRFHVIPLRKHEADYVAGTIRFMMGTETEDNSSQNNSMSFFRFRMSEPEPAGSNDDFRIDADVEYNRLLLWCNDVELESVRELLIDLGEMPIPGGNPARRRVFEIDDVGDAIQTLERLQKAWDAQGQKNPLLIQPLPEIQKDDSPIPFGPASPDKLEAPGDKSARENPMRNQEPTAGQQPVDESNPGARELDRRSAGLSGAIRESIGFSSVADPFETFGWLDAYAPLDQDAFSETTPNDDAAPPDARFQLISQSSNDGDSADSDSEDSAADLTASDPPVAGSGKPTSGEDTTLDRDAASNAASNDDVRSRENEPGTTDATPPGGDRSEQLRRLLEQLQRQRAAGQQKSSEPAPIQIRVTPNGEILLESDDTEALDLFEEMLEELAPPRKDWQVFELKYPTTWAYGIELTLKDIFKEEMKGEDDKGGMRYNPYFGFMPGGGNDKGPRRMSARKPLKIISDRDTHTILVQGATRDQLTTIADLIDVYDRPLATESATVRMTKVVPIKYSNAKVVAEAIKDVYRDLLSDNDKALQSNKQNDKEQRPVRESYTFIYGGEGQGGDTEQDQQIKFKGLLSIGIDEVSNMLIVSASEGLLNNVVQIIESLDEAARPNAAVQVVPIDSRINVTELQKRLGKIFGPKPPAQNPNQNQNRNGQNGQNGPPNGAVQFSGE